MAADRILVQQVRHKAGKIKGGDFPHPKSAAALLGPGDSGDNGKAGILNDIALCLGREETWDRGCRGTRSGSGLS